MECGSDGVVCLGVFGRGGRFWVMRSYSVLVVWGGGVWGGVLVVGSV